MSKEAQEKFKGQFGEKKALGAISFLKTAKQNSLEKKVEEVFDQAKLLLKSERNKLMDELKDNAKIIDKNNSNLLKTLSKFANTLEDARVITL